MKHQVAIIGLGRFGQSVARELIRLGHDVVGIDMSEKNVNDAVRDIPNSIILDATNKQALEDADMHAFDIVVVAIGDNQQASILCTLLLKELGAPLVVAKAQDTYHQTILERVGADRVIQPERDMGMRVARSIAVPNLLDFMSLGEGYSIVEIVATENMVGRTLAQLDIRRKAGVNVLAIKHDNNINPVPKGDDTVRRGDTLVVAGPDESIEKLKNW